MKAFSFWLSFQVLKNTLRKLLSLNSPNPIKFNNNFQKIRGIKIHIYHKVNNIHISACRSSILGQRTMLIFKRRSKRYKNSPINSSNSSFENNKDLEEIFVRRKPKKAKKKSSIQILKSKARD